MTPSDADGSASLLNTASTRAQPCCCLRVTLAVYSHVIGDSHREAVEKLASVLDVLDPDGPISEANRTMIQ